MSGWIRLHRSMLNHWLWEGEKFTRAQAWMDLLLWARYAPGDVRVRSYPIKLQRGQQARSEVTLAKTWGWSRDRVRRFLDRLVSEGMIIQEKRHQTTIITICKYDDFQSDDTREKTSTNTGTQQEPDRNQDTIEEGNKGKKESKTPIVPSGDATNGYPDDFEELWKAYPKRKGSSKKAAHKAWSARLKQGARHEDIMAGARAYARFCEHEGKLGTEYVKLAQTFLGPDEHYLADWSIGDCPHQQIAEIWNEVMPSHIARVSVEDLIPSARGYADLGHAWHHLKTVPRRSSGKPVFETVERGLDFYRMVWGKLAASPRLQEESSSRWCKFTWAVKVDTTVAIAKDEYS